MKHSIIKLLADETIVYECAPETKPMRKPDIIVADQEEEDKRYIPILKSWEPTVKTYPTKKEDEQKWTDYVRNESELYEDEKFRKAFSQGIKISDKNVKLEDVYVEPKGIHCNRGGYAKHAVLNTGIDISDLAGTYSMSEITGVLSEIEKRIKEKEN